MEQEFNLSEKITGLPVVLDSELPDVYGFLKDRDVKEFIKRLKEEVKEREKEDPQDSKLAYTFNSWSEDVCEIIDKLAGDKLI